MVEVMIKIYQYAPEERFGSNTYILESNGEYAVIDPSVSYQTIISKQPQIENKIKYILLTHCHFDHILEIKSWVSYCSSVIIGADDEEGLSDPYLNCYLGFLGISEGYFGSTVSVKDGDTLSLGGEEIRIIATPGHTPGSVCYRIRDHIFVGDTVFEKGGYGRCDLPRGDIDSLEKSLIKLLTRENDATLYPGHGNKTTIKEVITYFI